MILYSLSCPDEVLIVFEYLTELIFIKRWANILKKTTYYWKKNSLFIETDFFGLSIQLSSKDLF